MILHALADLYDRRSKSPDPSERPAPIGFESKPIAFVVEVDKSGELVQIRDHRTSEGKRKVGKPELVPQGVKKASGVAANLLWDSAEYVLGCPVEAKSKPTPPERLRQQHAAFRARIEDLPASVRDDEGVRAVLRFLDRLDLDMLGKDAAWPEIVATNPILSFRLHGDDQLVCQRPDVRRAWLDALGGQAADGRCLVTGESAAIERLHPAIKGVWNAQTSGANIVSFNLDAFRSYGKEQGANAPIGKPAAAKYTTALNDLLTSGSRQRVQIGDASTVFWSEQRTPLEDDFLLLIGEPPKDDPEAGTDRVRRLYESVRTGQYLANVQGDTRFFVLGLAPNAARIAVRFWQVGTVAEMVGRVARWFDDIAIVHAPSQSDHLSLFRLLTACAVQGKADNVPPNLGGDILRAILAGSVLPQSWLNAAIQRCKAEQSVTHPRAAGIKACINRRASSNEEKLTVSLDTHNTNAAYRLGRLFAVFERIQEEANPGINATIRDRYFGAASSNPLSVFPTLNRLKNHHLAKLDNRGRARNLERLVGEVMDGLPADCPFPSILPLNDQGRFAVGYYHQRQHPSTYRSQPEQESTP
ncbi:MAG TPA: type I-C CRISPR-associated protein Cas8c/Csd1 [Xanthomonadaceae bacterium]|nr:type I-C CRISPR-associated protein Cas8c/Csd1 [Xanthomonadaceae bacterium]